MLKTAVQQGRVIEGERTLEYVEPNARMMRGKGAFLGIGLSWQSLSGQVK
jgi:hypothetical protein